MEHASCRHVKHFGDSTLRARGQVSPPLLPDYEIGCVNEVFIALIRSRPCHFVMPVDALINNVYSAPRATIHSSWPSELFRWISWNHASLIQAACSLFVSRSSGPIHWRDYNPGLAASIVMLLEKMWLCIRVEVQPQHNTSTWWKCVLVFWKWETENFLELMYLRSM